MVVEGGGDRKGMEGKLGRDGMVGIEGKGGNANLGTVGIVGLVLGMFGIVGIGGILGMVGMVGKGGAWRRRRFVAAAEHISLLKRARSATIKAEKRRIEEAMASLSCSS